MSDGNGHLYWEDNELYEFDEDEYYTRNDLMPCQCSYCCCLNDVDFGACTDCQTGAHQG